MSNIMVVDDDANIRAILKYRFEKEDFTVCLAENGVDALEQIGNEVPDLVILDLMMPEMNGLELLSHLRENPRTVSTPVIVLTALGRTPFCERSRELRPMNLITKPFSPRHLVDEVKRALDGVCISTQKRWGESQQSNPREALLEFARS